MLQREIREAHSRFQLLQSRYDHLEAKSRAQAELHGGSFDQMEELNSQLRELRRNLQQITEERDELLEKADLVGDLMDR